MSPQLPETHAPPAAVQAGEKCRGGALRRRSPPRRARPRSPRRLRSTWFRRIVLFAAAPLALLLLVLSAGLIRHVYFDRTSLPDIEPFIRFEPPTTGKV